MIDKKMNIEEAIKHFKEGKRIRRKSWFIGVYKGMEESSYYDIVNESIKKINHSEPPNEYSSFYFLFDDILGDDWEIFDENNNER